MELLEMKIIIIPEIKLSLDRMNSKQNSAPKKISNWTELQKLSKMKDKKNNNKKD